MNFACSDVTNNKNGTDTTIINYEMILSMQRLEKLDLNDRNVDNFFNEIDELLEQLHNNNINFNTQKDKKNYKNKNQTKIIKTKNTKKNNNITEILWEYYSLHIYLQNVRSLRKKNHIIKPKTIDSIYDIIALTETFLNEGNLDQEYFFENFSVFRCDRSIENSMKKSGGGTLIAIKKSENYSTEKIDLTEFNVIELVGVKMLLNNGKVILVFCAYIPPDRSYDNNAYNIFASAIKTNINENDIVILLGDFNLSNVKYYFDENDKLVAYNFIPKFTADFFNEINSLGLRQINYVENPKGNILDLIFLNDEIDFNLHKGSNPIVNLDTYHPSIECVIQNVIPIKVISKKQEIIETIYDYKRTDFSAMNNYFKSIDLSAIIQNIEVNKSFECFYNTVECAFQQFVPKIRMRPKNSRPWYNAELKKLRNLRNREFLKKKDNIENAHDEYAKKFDDLSKNLYEQYNSDLSRNIKKDPKKFWSFVREQKTSKGHESKMKYVDKIGTNDSDIVNLFAEFFSSVFSGERNGNEINKVLNDLDDKMQTVITETEVYETMKNFPLNKGIGVDNFPPIIIKNCRYSLVKPITTLFNKSLASSTLPNCLKSSHIIPIYKKGAKENVENYRSIAVLPSLLKLFEKIMYKKILTHFKSRISQCQHGFVPGKSINTNLMELVTFANEAFAQKCQVDVLYTDFTKAFDKVDHAILIKKMNDMNFDSGIIRWIASYLNSRSMQVKINKCLSKKYLMHTGVPAGSILGPILFLIYINDLPTIFERYCKILLFADDCKVVMKIKKEEDLLLFQTEINKLLEWCKNNKLKLNILKCAVLTLSRSDDKLIGHYTMSGSLLLRVNDFRDLGIRIDERLTFKKHIESTVAACNSTMGFIKRIAGKKFDVDTLVILFNSFVKSKLMFGIIIWYPASGIEREYIEGVQKRFTMMALKEYPNVINNFVIRPYDVRCSDLNIFSISSRYVYACCVFIYDLLHRNLESSYLKSKLIWNNMRRTRHTIMLLKTPSYQNGYLHNQSFWSSVRLFNDNISQYDNNNERNKYLKAIKDKR